jgi:signal peptidase I
MKSCSQPFDDAHAVKCELAGEVLRSSGALRLQVAGWSMLPAVWPGDVLVIERATTGEVSRGDIVLFGRDRRLFAHRVVAENLENSAILTRGDAMPGPDPIVRENELLGRVSSIMRKGRSIAPSPTRHFSERMVAGLVRSSEVAARVVVGVRGMYQAVLGQN